MVISNHRKKHLAISKKGLRALGIAESFDPRILPTKSIVVGVIMRGDLIVDGFCFTYVTLGGMDATKNIVKMIKRLSRPDLSAVLLSGTVIALYNVVDLEQIHDTIKLPIIALTYDESKGIDKALLRLSDGKKRLEIHKKNRQRIPIILKNGLKVFIRPWGLTLDEAILFLNKFTIHGRYPEPIRVAKILARSILLSIKDGIFMLQ